jgi:hypothetical protein
MNLERLWYGAVRDLGTKFLALALAVVLFFIIHQKITVTVDKTLSILVHRPGAQTGVAGLHVIVPEGIQVLAPPRTVRIRIKGPKEKIDPLVNGYVLGSFQVPVEALREAPTVTRAVLAGEIEFNVPDEVKVEMDPLNLELVRTRRERLKARVAVTGKPAAGFRLEEPVVVAPADPLVTGPEPVLQSLQGTFELEPVDVDGRSETVTVSGALPGAEWERGLRLEEPVSVTARVVRVDEKETLRIPIRLLRDPKDQRKIVLDSDSQEVTFVGPRPALEELKRATVAAFVDVTDLTSESPRRSVSVEFRGLPKGVRPEGEPHALVQIVE